VTIESHFFHLSVLDPVNPYVCRRYASFLSMIESEPRLAALWRERVDTLESMNDISIDPIARKAFHLFPLLPRTLAAVRRMADVSESNPAQIQDTDLSSSDPRSASCSDTNPALLDPFTEHDEAENAPSRIREMALSITIPPIRDLFILSVVLFSLVILLAGILSDVLTTHHLSDFDRYMEAVNTTCEIGRQIDKTALLLLKEALVPLSGVLNASEEAQMLGRMLTGPRFRDQRQASAKSLNSAIDQFHLMYGRGIAVGSSLSDLLSAPIVTLSVLRRSGSDVTESPYTSSIASALSSLSQYFFTQPLDVFEPLNARTELLNAVSNARNVSDAALQLADVICASVSSYIEGFRLAFWLLLYFLVGLVAAALPLFALQLTRLRTAWRVVLRAIRTLPHIATDGVLSKLGVSTNEPDADRESRVFTHMQSARDVHWGSELSMQVLLLVLSVALAACPFAASVAVTVTGVRRLSFIPYRVFLLSTFSTRAARALQIANRRHALDADVPFFRDTRELLLAETVRTEAEMSQAATNLIFGLENRRETGLLGMEGVDQLFVFDAGWLSSDALHDALVGLPVPVCMDVLLHLFTDFLARSQLPGYAFPRRDVNFALLDNEMLDVLGGHLFDPIVHGLAGAAAVTARLALVCHAMAIVSVVLSLAGFAATVFDLARIRSAFRFALCSVAMVSPRHVLQNPALLAVFAGNFRAVCAGHDGLVPAFERAQDEAEQCIVITDGDDAIVWCNRRAQAVFRAAPRTPIDDVLRFDAPIGERPTDTHVTVLETGAAVHMRVSRAPLERDSAVLFMVDLTAADEKARMIAEAEAQVEQLRASVVPRGVAATQLDVRDCVVLVVALHGIAAFAAKHAPEEAADRLERFVAAVDGAVRRART
jgi:hypothetical protein